MSKRLNLTKGPISWMARNPVAANLVMFSLIIGGVVFAFNMQQEVFPNVELDTINITMAYPGASPAEVEQGILLAIEESVRPLDGVKEVRSRANEGFGRVSVELNTDANRTKALADVKNAVDRITSFPLEAERPIVNLPEIRADAISLILYGDLEEKVMHALGEQVRNDLLALPEVSVVEVSGTRPLEIGIEVPEATLRKYGLTLPQIAHIIRRTAIELPAGAVKTKGGEILLRTTERRNIGAEYATIPILNTQDGTPVLLGDIAEIKDSFAETDVTTSFEGKPAIMVQVSSMGDQSPNVVAQAVKNYAKTAKLPPGVKVTTYLDRAKMYDERVDLLLRNAAMGLALVLVILGLFLEPKLAFWVTMGIPISFLGSLILMPAIGMSLNMITLFAFIVTLGMVVDDAIVVGENTFRLRQAGMPPLQAAIQGAKEMGSPVFFSIATTIAAFSPLLFIPGVNGKIWLCIPTVVILVLVLSLVESFFVLPAHLGHSKQRLKPKSRLSRMQEKFAQRVERFVQNYYLPWVKLALRQRVITLAIAITVFVSSLGLVAGGQVKMIDFPKDESDWVVAVARLPYGVAVEETDAVMDRLVKASQKALAENGGDAINLGIFSMRGIEFGPGPDGSNVTSVLTMLVPTDQRNITSSEFVDAWREKIGEIPGIESLYFNSTTGRNTKPIDVEIAYGDIDVLEESANYLAAQLATFDGVKDVDNGIQLGKPQMDFTLTPAGINAGFTSTDLAAQVRAAFYGSEALRQQRGRHEIRTMVRLPRAEREKLSSVDEMVVRTPSGGEMLLREAANVSWGRAYTAIRRTNGKRIVRVQADIEEGKANAQEIMGAINQKILPKLKARVPDISLGASGRQRDFNEFLDFLKTGFSLALLIMFVLIAIPLRSYLQPALVVMTAIPFGFTGAVLGHLLMGMELSLVSMMGLVALAGVVVNDSLVLVTAANKFKASGMSAIEAAGAAAQQRFRPVILTSLTTFGGLAPMIFESSVQARVLIPMAVSLGYGVLFATIITLFLVPCLYVMSDNLSLRFHRALKRLLGDNEPVELNSEPFELGDAS
jgi:multidrug efflux pump subunit AcrB